MKKQTGKPILMSGPMVRAIIARAKFQTRRLAGYEEPPWKAGELLYVRETWAHGAEEGEYVYRATEPKPGAFSDHRGRAGAWSPSLLMPKDAARIWLRVTKVEAELTWDLDDHAALQEGMGVVTWEDVLELRRKARSSAGKRLLGARGPAWWAECPPARRFAIVWDLLVAEAGERFAGGPAVWAITFELLQAPLPILAGP